MSGKTERHALQSAQAYDDNQILNLRQWCALNGISLRTGHRILASGEGPIVTQLSSKRIGISYGNNSKWLASRARVS